MRISDWSSDVCSSDLIARKDCVRDRPGDDRKPCGPIAARAEATIVLMEFAIPGAQISAVGAPRPAGRSGVEGRPEFVAVIIIALLGCVNSPGQPIFAQALRFPHARTQQAGTRIALVALLPMFQGKAET